MIVLLPLGEIFAVEEDDARRRRRARFAARRNRVRMRPVGIVYMPGQAGQDGRILVALLSVERGGEAG